MKLFVVYSFSLLCFLLFSCSNPGLDAAKKKLEESNCKLEQSMEILENGTNTMLMAKEIGLEKELDAFNKLQADTTISCDSLKNAWHHFSDLVYQKSK